MAFVPPPVGVSSSVWNFRNSEPKLRNGRISDNFSRLGSGRIGSNFTNLATMTLTATLAAKA
ncbi:MAG: hypothetical protein IIA82_07145 [Thaumarchaeota archaeon]|nr:hypothetical protein [Nitrososphaerota archaeon]